MLNLEFVNNNMPHGQDFEKKKKQERKKSILYLIENFLRIEGYIDCASKLIEEARLDTSQYTVCDNIDLDTILLEYENYYYVRFQKKPKISKLLTGSNTEINTNKKNKTKLTKKIQKNVQDVPKSLDNSASITVTPMMNEKNLEFSTYDFPVLDLSHWKNDWFSYAEIISKEILANNPGVNWFDIKGLSTAKQLLQEAVLLPNKYPDLFTGLCTPWKAMLLYGPPGTGKTLLAKAVASECNTTFFNVSPSTLIAKWRGDSEKLIKVMFEMAEQMAPSTIFIDELDAITSKRIDHEASRRITSQLLMHMDGLLSSDKRIFILATSNHPWDLDSAIFRRFEKRMFIDLPDAFARYEMFQHYLIEKLKKNKHIRCQIDCDSLAQSTNGYSGSDIKLVCKETAMQAMRLILSSMDVNLKNTNCLTITTDDVLEAIKKTRPTTKKTDNNKYHYWESEYEST